MKDQIDKELEMYEKGFEDGYQVAKRLYKPFLVEVLSEDLYRTQHQIASSCGLPYSNIDK